MFSRQSGSRGQTREPIFLHPQISVTAIPISGMKLRFSGGAPNAFISECVHDAERDARFLTNTANTFKSKDMSSGPATDMANSSTNCIAGLPCKALSCALANA